MLRITRIAFFAATMSLSLCAAAFQPAIPLSVEKPFRLTIGPILRSDFRALNNADLSVDFTHRIGGGFEWGVALHGGAAARSLFAPNEYTIGTLGAELMGRYFGAVSDVFYFGIQVDLGYTQNLSATASGGSAVARLSVPFVMHFEKSVAFFLAPAVVFEGALLATNRMAASTFGQSLGANLGIGMLFYTEGPGVYVAMRPGWQDFRYPGDINAEFTIGLVIDM